MLPSLWEFSLAQYRREGVERSCLYWQDYYGIDTCLLLAVVWLGAGGQLLSAAEISMLQRRLHCWQSVITRPLRTFRRCLKRGLEGGVQSGGENSWRSIVLAALYQKTKQLELSSERLALFRLQRHSEAAGWRPQEVTVEFSEATVASNLSCLLVECSPSRDELKALLVLWQKGVL